MGLEMLPTKMIDVYFLQKKTRPKILKIKITLLAVICRKFDQSHYHPKRVYFYVKLFPCACSGVF